MLRHMDEAEEKVKKKRERVWWGYDHNTIKKERRDEQEAR